MEARRAVKGSGSCSRMAAGSFSGYLAQAAAGQPSGKLISNYVCCLMSDQDPVLQREPGFSEKKIGSYPMYQVKPVLKKYI